MIRNNSVLFILLCSGLLFPLKAQQVQHQPIVFNFQSANSSETSEINPFTDYRLNVIFSLDGEEYVVPGYYAADGNAAETSASEGNVWRCVFTPDRTGTWTYTVSFRKGKNIATSFDAYEGEAVLPHDGKRGNLEVVPASSDSDGFDRHGRLAYQGSRYLHHYDGTPLLKFGANSPENFLAYTDFDGTYSYDNEKSFLKTWAPHVRDWQTGDPTWQNGKGKGIIGALNYLAAQQMNAVYLLMLNIEGDARDVWPFITHKTSGFKRYDVSKLAQWDVVFGHAERLGIIVHIITQEKENELILDNGNTEEQRKLYYRELVARFGYHKNIIWNMGEENGQADFWRQGQNDQQRFAMIRYLKDIDPYKHPLVIHTMSEEVERKRIISPLLGFDRLDGLSMQVANVFDIHHDISHWIEESEKANRPWITMMDEIGPWHTGTRTDADDPAHDTVRQEVLWGTLMAGGAGVEWYFGWNKPPHDLNAEDWRSRENIWKQTAVAAAIFTELPYTEMESVDGLLEPSDNYCFAKTNEVYLIYLKNGGETTIDLSEASGSYGVTWIDPTNGKKYSSDNHVKAGKAVTLGLPPDRRGKDWVILLRAR